ncbi:hypothetical protein B5X24_HaOG215237 [Helicoverpa armigera]|nr:hypothetical protein B5X24_HaOG215237 [Helicoverpa armigera]
MCMRFRALSLRRALALDGTFYQKSGIISGGSLDLARKAKRWDEKHLSQLKSKKEKLTEELRESMKKSRKESELTTVDSQIRGLESRLKYAITDRDTTLKQIKALDAELAEFEMRIEMFGPQVEDIERTIHARDLKIQEIKENMNNVEDVVFRGFCRDIGVANIRQYEERELRAQQERAKRRMEFDAHIDRITSNLEFERSRDTQKNVTRWERCVQDAEDELEGGRQAEAKQRQDIDADLRRADALKADRAAARARQEQADELVNKARKDLTSIQKEIQTVQKQIASIESRIESKRSDRHNILRQCKIDDIIIPLLEGNLEDTAEGESEQSSMSTTQQYRKDSRIRVDYSSLSENLKELEEPDEIKRKADKLQKHINSLQNTVDKIQAPNMRAMQKLNEVREKVNATNEAFVAARKRAHKAKLAFEKVKKERHDKFIECFEHVANEIDAIYKALAMNQSAQAFLGPENPEEPYLDGINYNCVAPGKRFQPMSNLSGGEKTVAALALLFAIHRSADVGECRGRAAELQAQLEEVAAALGDARVDKHEEARRRKKQEIVESFKRDIPGVYDRMINMCQPTHKRYNVAITKVLGKYMEAIVVDTEKTARRCIQVLKERMLEPETFLPLDYIQAKPLRERLRDIKEPKNVKLLFDVLRYEPPAIHRAVLFVTNNALVCETPEDASRVAYDLDRSKNSRYDVITSEANISVLKRQTAQYSSTDFPVRYSYQPAPFFLLDEIDAALDNTNIGKVASYIRSKKGSLQTIVISLKEEFYGCADALVGICSEPADCLVSDVMTLSLEDYSD